MTMNPLTLPNTSKIIDWWRKSLTLLWKNIFKEKIMQIIITHPNFDYLAQEIAKNNPKTVRVWNVDFKRFSDGTPNLFIHNVKEDIEHQEVTYIGDFSRDEDLFMQIALMRWIIDYNAGKLRIIAPYFHTGTMERIQKKWEIATAKYLADEFSGIPSGRNAKNSLHTFDIHALQERFFFDSRMINAELHTAMSLIKEKISKDTVIVFPDEGAQKRFAGDFEWYETIICSKIREWDTRKVTVKEGNPKGKKLLIVDDLIQSGGTIRETAELLRSLWAIRVDAFATHGVFPWESYKKLAPYLDILYTTDSIPENKNRVSQVQNMEMLSITPLIEKILFRN